MMFALLSSAALAAAKATPTEASVLARDEVAIEIMVRRRGPAAACCYENYSCLLHLPA